MICIWRTNPDVAHPVSLKDHVLESLAKSGIDKGFAVS